MATKIGLSQLRNQPPDWVLPALVAITFICQGLPPIIGGYNLAANTVKITGLVCDVTNLLCAAIAMFLGKSTK